ncbi:MAG: ABC transporter permease [Anaerolineales bacterium]
MDWGPFGEIVSRTLAVSGAALGLSAVLGIPSGATLALARFPGRRLLVLAIYTGMGLPPVAVGLAVYLTLSRTGPLGTLGWLFTPTAMILAQTVIALPLVCGLTMAAIEAVDPRLRQQIRSLGARPRQEIEALLWESRPGVAAALIAGMGGILSEVGAAMLVGGNIDGRTRVLSTAIVLVTRQGQFALALALGGALIGLTGLVTAALLRLQRRPGTWPT